MGSSFDFTNADGTQGVTIKCKFSCAPPSAGNNGGFILQDSAGTQVNSGVIQEGGIASFPVSQGDVQAGIGYTLYFRGAASGAGTFTIKIGVFQGATALTGVMDPQNLSPGQVKPPIQLDANGFATADTNIASATQTFYGVAIFPR